MNSPRMSTEPRRLGEMLRPLWYAEGGGRELLRLAFPFVLSSSIWTLQIALDRILLSRADSDAVGAAMVSALLFWTPISLLQNISGYASTFVAQYTGAGKPQRVGPAVWQAIYFSLFAGIAFLGLLPLAGPLVDLGGHQSPLRELEITYFHCLCFSALPTLLTASANSFFAGRGDSWTVLYVDASGLFVNACSAYTLIYGHFGFPALGIAVAGWATVIGSSTSACVALTLMLRPRYRVEFNTTSGWRLDADLLRRLLRFGVPNGLLNAVDCLAFTAFIMLVGRQGPVELAASSIAFTINIIAFLPMLGVGQAVCVLVGQRLGENRSDLAERSTWTGLGIAACYMALICVVLVCLPTVLANLFRNEDDLARWSAVAALIPGLLRFMAVYLLFDSMSLVFSFALRGAGDTRFVTAVAATTSWPIMVIPTWAAWQYGWGLYWAWAFASSYIILLAITYLFRFRQGKWQSMRVIETVPIPVSE